MTNNELVTWPNRPQCGMRIWQENLGMWVLLSVIVTVLMNYNMANFSQIFTNRKKTWLPCKGNISLWAEYHALLIRHYPFSSAVYLYCGIIEFRIEHKHELEISTDIEDMIFSCDQAALQMVFASVCPSVRLSVRLSVCHTFLTMFPSSYHHEIFRSYYQWPK